jgi:hypothetical protein
VAGAFTDVKGEAPPESTFLLLMKEKAAGNSDLVIYKLDINDVSSERVLRLLLAEIPETWLG